MMFVTDSKKMNVDHFDMYEVWTIFSNPHGNNILQQHSGLISN